MSEAESIAVIGAGSYGTALAIQVARQGRPVRLWGRNAEAMNQMAEERLAADYWHLVAGGVGDEFTEWDNDTYPRASCRTAKFRLQPA